MTAAARERSAVRVDQPGVGNGSRRLPGREWAYEIPATRRLELVWVNREVRLPSGIPCMSSATGLAYDLGRRGGVWTMEALDWASGESVFFRELGRDLKFNSAYAATEVGVGGGLHSGTLFGILRLHP